MATGRSARAEAVPVWAESAGLKRATTPVSAAHPAIVKIPAEMYSQQALGESSSRRADYLRASAERVASSAGTNCVRRRSGWLVGID
jgi:hypothetical protein